MNRNLQASWVLATEYWSRKWKNWIAVVAVTTAWLWAVFVSVPSLIPFLFMQIKPINDPAVERTYHRELAALILHLPILAFIIVAAGIVGGLALTALMRRQHPDQTKGYGGALMAVLSSAFMTGLALFGMGMMQVPIGGHQNPAWMAIRVLTAIIIFAVLVPWTFWHSTLRLNGRGSFWKNARSSPRTMFGLPWTWLVTMVVSEMISASFAWATTVNDIGTLVLALLIALSGLLHQSVANFYMRPSPRSGHLKKTS